MIQVSKAERNIIIAALPNEPIAKTKRKYYVPEVYRVLRLLPGNPEAASICKEMEKEMAQREAYRASLNSAEEH